MKGLAITSKGIEDIAAREIKDYLKTNTEIRNSCVIFGIKRLDELCLLCYKSQSAERILYLLDSLKLSDEFFDEIIGKLKKTELMEWLKNKRYSIKCLRHGTHKFSSIDVESKLKNGLAGFFKKEYSSIADFHNPEVMIIVYIIEEMCYIGIDFSGFELQKRDYKIFMHPASLRATLAYALIRMSDFKQGESLLDPFIGDGVVVIEAAAYSSGFPIRHYLKDKFVFLKFSQFKDFDFDGFFSKLDKKAEKSKIYGCSFQFKNVDNAKKNAKIAGVIDLISLSRVEIEWLDVKFKSKSVDKIVTKIPNVKTTPGKLLNNFFNQSQFILKDNGKISVITYTKDTVLQFAKNNNFKLEHEREVHSGKQILTILVLSKL